MNMICDFLKDHRKPYRLDQYILSEELDCILLAPRFRASSHILYLVFSRGDPKPTLVVKVPRLACNNDSVEREAANLSAIQASRAGGFRSIPYLVAIPETHNRKILIETALSGKSMDPAFVRKNPSKCIEMTTDWLLNIYHSTYCPREVTPDWYERLVEQPIQGFAGKISLNEEEACLLEQTLERVEAMRAMDLPIMFEHGDLSQPNILVQDQGTIGVVDWEQAEPLGLPACDLFFFLAYVGFAINKSREKGDHLSAFQSAFFNKDAWARPYVQTYARQLQLPSSSLTPLFLLSWFRHLSGLLNRITSTEAGSEYVRPETAEWIRNNRFYALWRYAVNHSSELVWV
jgi:aminoglycoside phosphotransferase